MLCHITGQKWVILTLIALNVRCFTNLGKVQMIRHYHFEKVRILAVCQEMFDLGKCDLGDSVIVRERSKFFIVRWADQVLCIIIVEDQEPR